MQRRLIAGHPRHLGSQPQLLPIRVIPPRLLPRDGSCPVQRVFPPDATAACRRASRRRRISSRPSESLRRRRTSSLGSTGVDGELRPWSRPRRWLLNAAAACSAFLADGSCRLRLQPPNA